MRLNERPQLVRSFLPSHQRVLVAWMNLLLSMFPEV
jgi:hypothetical protein